MSFLPQSLLLQVVIYMLCFVSVWFGAGLVVSSVQEMAKTWKLPEFLISFFLLGFLTSLPETSIGAISVLSGDAEIMVGNLLGGVIVVFLLIIPLLAIFGNGVKIPNQIGRAQLIHLLVVVVAPAFLTADQRLNRWEGTFLILLYGSMIFTFSSKQSFFEKMRKNFATKKRKMLGNLLKILVGVAVLVGSGSVIVELTVHFAKILEISPFFVGLVVVALGTNIPEFSIVFKSILSRKKEIAFGDYLGSASVNTLLLGIFSLLYGNTIQLPNHFLQRFSFLVIGSILLYFFIRTKGTLSRKEGAILLLLYVGFILVEVFFAATLSSEV